MKTDWKKTGIKIGSITSENSEHGGTEFAKKALNHILGEEWIKHAVETAIYTGQGAELAMNCLRHLSSETAADYAYSIYKSDPNLEHKSSAVWLIKHLAVKKSFGWIEAFLDDQNVNIWGIGVLDQLLYGHVIDYEEEQEQVDYLLKLALEKPNGKLKENVGFIKNYLDVRTES